MDEVIEVTEMDEFDVATTLIHYGTLHKSGRYPWGSGENPNQHSRDFLAYVDDLHKKGMSDVEIAKAIGGFGDGKFSTTQLRALRSIAKNEVKKDNEAQAARYKAKGMSNQAIADRMGLKNESNVRALLNPTQQAKTDQLTNVSNMIKDQVDQKKYVDVGLGTETNLGISSTQLSTAVALLREQGYSYHRIKSQQLGTGKFTEYKVLAAPDTTFKEVAQNQSLIKPLGFYTEDNGTTIKEIKTPISMDSKRVEVKYGSEGGSAKDGVIELRRDVADTSLGASRYAQVRIKIDDTHYLKGMAMYADDLPDGIDARFNTNKENTGNKLDAMKGVKDDPTNPFGTITRQRTYIDADGKEKQSVVNIVGGDVGNEEGRWGEWSKSISSQVLSKQTPSLAKRQLDEKYQTKAAELEEINSLTNPEVKKKLLESFADGADSSAVHLKAAALPRQSTHVILPINSLKDSEVYAPNYKNGEKVVLVRYPHGGIFEIPELTVNNRNKEALSSIKNAKDAVGINSRVAERLSGADFDGDTVLVIPNNDKKIKTMAPLSQLKNFDPKLEYKGYDGMPKMSARTKQLKMGDVSNLITDMTIKGAPPDQIARAVRHSMVVIDAEKHNLDYRRSAKDNGIADLKKQYQGDARNGASTIVSRASSEKRVAERTLRKAADGGPIDKETGKLVYVNTGASYEKNGKTVHKTTGVAKLALVDDAHDLVSENGGTVIERVYADHANRLKALANQARKELVSTGNSKYSPTAKTAHESEVKSLKAKLNIALKNKPLERQAQLVANETVKQKMLSNPDVDKDELKKLKGSALTVARARVGASKTQIDITPTEWTAIQSGAISSHFLNQILDNTDLDKVKEYATPRAQLDMTPAKLSLARTYEANGYTQAEIAEQLGVSTSTLSRALKG